MTELTMAEYPFECMRCLWIGQIGEAIDTCCPICQHAFLKDYSASLQPHFTPITSAWFYADSDADEVTKAFQEWFDTQISGREITDTHLGVAGVITGHRGTGEKGPALRVSWPAENKVTTVYANQRFQIAWEEEQRG